MEPGQPPAKKKRIRRQSAIDKKEKGLRHFAVRVCQKVESKLTTTYNEVADELVTEVLAPNLNVDDADAETDRRYDEKNIRRRVYDALNVLLAMDIIEKKKKEIRWRGLPDGNSSAGLELHTPDSLRAELEAKRLTLQAKERHLAQLQDHITALDALVRRNTGTAHEMPPPRERVDFPFILVDAKRDTDVNLEIDGDENEVTFTMSGPFVLHDDIDVLIRMGLAQGPDNDPYISASPRLDHLENGQSSEAKPQL